MLAAAGLTAEEIMTIKNEISGTVEVEITEQDIWKVQTAMLMAIVQNTARTALALSGGAVPVIHPGTPLYR